MSTFTKKHQRFITCKKDKKEKTIDFFPLITQILYYEITIKYFFQIQLINKFLNDKLLELQFNLGYMNRY